MSTYSRQSVESLESSLKEWLDHEEKTLSAERDYLKAVRGGIGSGADPEQPSNALTDLYLLSSLREFFPSTEE
jgi:hypothetical protein